MKDQIQMEINQWFDNGEWRNGWLIDADETTDKEEFKHQYLKNPERWHSAFEFLKNINPDNLQVGKHFLDGDNLFASVDEYFSKNEEDTRFEAHQKYADIQYLVSGEEKIGVLKLEQTNVIVPYDEAKDIAFFTAPQNNYRQASPKVFFIFFTRDAHRPCVKMNSNALVKKVVMKVRMDD